MSDWISVDDRLPDDGILVLAAMEDGEVWPGYFDGETWRDGHRDLMGDVTHWMDFPEPPKRNVNPA